MPSISWVILNSMAVPESILVLNGRRYKVYSATGPEKDFWNRSELYYLDVVF